MRTDFHAMLLCQPDGRAHMVEVRGVEAAGDVGDINERHQRSIITELIQPERFPHVAVEQ